MLVSALLTSPMSLAPHVKHLRYVSPGEFTPLSPSGYLPADTGPILAHLPTILHICPNLESLSLENMNDLSLRDWQHLFPESAAAIKNIKYFSFSYYTGWRRGRNFSRVWWNIVARFTSLKHIRVADCIIDSIALVRRPDMRHRPGTPPTAMPVLPSVEHLELENICWCIEDMELFAPVLPNTTTLELKVIKIFPACTTAYHPLPLMFKKLQSLVMDCPSRILSNDHHICDVIAPPLRRSLKSITIYGGCSLCSEFFDDLEPETLLISLTQLRVCNGYENLRQLNQSVLDFVGTYRPKLKRVVIAAPSLSLVDKNKKSHGGVADIGRKNSWILADLDFVAPERPPGQLRREQILGISDYRLLELEQTYHEDELQAACCADNEVFA
ncbi:uncharacterized protein V1510DRAFT_416133 [Dipodascopsis tothii]|uniref:uncharacterized protein n=1 Tax=Dipodascopsis tothii TaxID=44089 RepID=UPI0034CF1FB4